MVYYWFLLLIKMYIWIICLLSLLYTHIQKRLMNEYKVKLSILVVGCLHCNGSYCPSIHDPRSYSFIKYIILVNSCKKVGKMLLNFVWEAANRKPLAWFSLPCGWEWKAVHMLNNYSQLNVTFVFNIASSGNNSLY